MKTSSLLACWTLVTIAAVMIFWLSQDVRYHPENILIGLTILFVTDRAIGAILREKL